MYFSFYNYFDGREEMSFKLFPSWTFQLMNIFDIFCFSIYAHFHTHNFSAAAVLSSSLRLSHTYFIGHLHIMRQYIKIMLCAVSKLSLSCTHMHKQPWVNHCTRLQVYPCEKYSLMGIWNSHRYNWTQTQEKWHQHLICYWEWWFSSNHSLDRHILVDIMWQDKHLPRLLTISV